MTRYTSNGFWLSSLTGVMAAIGVVASYPFPTLAQITPDQTLGAESSRLTPNVDVRGGMADRIDGGAIRGSNLFHSFQDFNVRELQRVYFANPQGIENILGRVTGSTRSNILGTLGVDGGANLFLINPNGIIFGPNAELDIRGSFLAGTADGFKFPDGSEFRAKDPNAPPLVTVSIPIGLQYGPEPPAALVSRADLTVGRDLKLSGGSVTSTGKVSAPEGIVVLEGVAGDVQAKDVTAQSATLRSSQNLVLEESQLRTTGDLNLLADGTVRVRDSVEKPFLALAGGNLLIQGRDSIDILALNHPQTPFQTGKDVTLVSDGNVSVDAHFYSGRNFSILNFAGEPGNFVSLYDPIFTVAGNYTSNGYTGPALKVQAGGTIDVTGDIRINSPDLTIVNPPSGTDEFLLGNFPSLILRAGNNVTITGNIDTSSTSGPAGPVTISSSNGDIFIRTSAIRTNSEKNSPNAGDITIQAKGKISLFSSSLDAGRLATSSNGGNISLIGSSVEIDRSSIFSDTISTNLNDTGGQIRIAAESISLKNQSIIDASTYGDAPGGNIVLEPLDINSNVIVRLENNSSISTTSGLGATATGRGGSIDIRRATDVSLSGGSRLETRALGNENAGAGNISVDFTNLLEISGYSSQYGFSSGLFTSSETTASGRGGTININQANNPTGTLTVSNGGVLSARNRSSSVGGNINVYVDTLKVIDGGQLLTSASGNGSAGDINITAIKSATFSGSDTNFGARPRINPPSVPDPNATGEVDEVEESDQGDATYGDSIDKAQLITSSSFSLTRNDNIESSTLIPHVSISATGDGTLDYYSFNVTDPNSIGVFDIDFGQENFGDPSSIDTQIFLFRLNGTTTRELRNNDDFRVSAGAGGSTSTYDSYIRYIFRQPGTYVLGVGRYPSSSNDSGIIPGFNGPPADRSNYTLQASIGSSALLNTGLVPNQGANSGLYARSEGSGGGGNVTINTGQLNIRDRAEVSATTAGLGRGGDVAVNVLNGGSVSLINSNISTAVQPGAVDNSSPSVTGGNITITGAGSVSLSDRASLDASTDGRSAGGSISVNVLDGGSVSLSNRSSIEARTLAGGNGGTVSVTANRGSVSLDSSSNISTAVSQGATGNGNNINVSTGSISLTGGSRLEALTLGTNNEDPEKANAGNINITVSDLLDISGVSPFGAYSGLLTSSERANSGRGGNITINSADNPQGILRVADGGFLSARTTGSSPGGNIEVNVRELQVRNGGQLITSGSSSGRAGDIKVTATDSVTISGSNPNFNPNGNTGNTSSGGTGLLSEVEQNDSISDAQLIDSSLFSLARNIDVESSTNIPHVSISGTGNGTFDYYSFEVKTSNSRGIFDIDNGFKGFEEPSGIDTQLFLFDRNGALLDSNDDSYITQGAGGSRSLYDSSFRTYDSYIEHTFAPGTYTIGVGRYSSAASNGAITGNTPNAPQTYTLQVSIDDPSLDPNRNFNPNQGANSGLFAQATDRGDAGAMMINTPVLTVQDNGRISASNVSSASEGITLQGINSLQVTGGSQISASTERGTAGSLSINPGQAAAGSIQISGANSRLSAQATGVRGNAGSVDINARQLTAEQGAEVTAANISGTSEDITLRNLETLQVNGGSQISASTQTGTAGSLLINPGQAAAESIQISGANSRLSAQATGVRGNAGSVDINAWQLTAEQGAEVTAANISGTSEDITLRNLETLQVNGGSQISASTQTGTAGSLLINPGQAAAESIQISGANSRLSAQATGVRGNAGSVDINARQLTAEQGAEVTAANISGTSEDITLQSLERLQVSGGSQISASTQTGTAGSLLINPGQAAAESIQISGANSRLSARATEVGGNAGRVDLNARQLTAEQGAEISVSNISGTSEGITLRNLETLNVLRNSQIEATTNTGRAGNLSVNLNSPTAASVLVSGNSALSVEATGNNSNSESGQVTVNAREVTLQDGSTISAATNAGQGQGVQLQNLERLSVNNSLISSSTETGIAGDVTIDASDSVTLRGTFTPLTGDEPQGGVVATAKAGGRAGSVTINTGDLLVRDGAEVSVSSPSGIAGNLKANADLIGLNRGSITAEAGQGEGGANIELNTTGFLRLDNESLISALATGNATGGNIKINAQYILASFPTGRQGSDIVADAILGNGGQITINALGIFGIQFRPQRTPLNDITASSQAGASGTVQLTTLGIDPSRGLAALPLNFVDASGLVGGQCSARNSADGEQSQFTITGRGGLPLNPTDPLGPDAEQVHWVSLDSKVNWVSLNPEAATQMRITPFNSAANLRQLAQFPVLCYQSWLSPTAKAQ